MIKNKNRLFIFWVALVFLAGCSQPLRSLMKLGAEQKAQQNFVKKQDLKFDLLFKDIELDEVRKGARKDYIISRYGEPVLENHGVFLYRKSADFFNSSKIYLEFDDKDILINIRMEKKQ